MDEAVKAIRSNPFVALADVAIALCFIFAVYAVSSTALSSRVVLFYNRDVRQKTLRTKFVASLSQWFAQQGETVTSKTRPVADGEITEFRGSNGKIKAQIWRNASFQRISVFHSLFEPGTAKWRDASRARALYLDLAKAIQSRNADISYLFLHGIVQPVELNPLLETGRRGRRQKSEEELQSAQNNEARQLSVQRAQSVFSLLQSATIISKDGQRASPSQLTARFVIPYGTGQFLYTSSSMPVGRVDLVLFYGDVKDTKTD